DLLVALGVIVGVIWAFVVFPSFRIVVLILVLIAGGLVIVARENADREQKQAAIKNAEQNQKKQETVELRADGAGGHSVEEGEAFLDQEFPQTAAIGPGGASRPMEFAEHQDGRARIDSSSTWISADGEITADTPAAFEKFLDPASNQALIFPR